MKLSYPASIEDLRNQIRGGRAPFIFLGSRSSTVIDFEKLEDDFQAYHVVDLSKMKTRLEMLENGQLLVEGAVSWQEAAEFCVSNGRRIMTSPTEELALCLSGVATSATGERCFSFGTLRDQIVMIEFMDIQGRCHELHASRPISALDVFSGDEAQCALKNYQDSYRQYASFKNAPFPRFEKEIDLMVGTEGQLGVITKAIFQTVPLEETSYLFFKLPKWEIEDQAHLEIFEKVDAFRDCVFACEFIDENSVSYLPDDRKLASGCDLIFLEIRKSEFERVYHELISQLEDMDQEQVFEVSPQRCREFRMDIPRYVFEANQNEKVAKLGTDVQASRQDFPRLIERYRAFAKSGLDYNVFGHFGDAHLHFNFMPTQSQYPDAVELLHQMYKDLASWTVSPFAEHGIGVLKKPFIQNYYTKAQKPVFKLLKSYFDPEARLFPNGFMCL